MSKYFYNKSTDKYYQLTPLNKIYKYENGETDTLISHTKLNNKFYANSLKEVQKSDTPFSQ